MSSDRVDLGSGHSLTYFARHGDDTGQRCGIIVSHPLKPDDTQCAWRGQCGGAFTFDVPAAEGLSGPRWTVESWDPLTLSPSLLCHCGDHGFIREGRWG